MYTLLAILAIAAVPFKWSVLILLFFTAAVAFGSPFTITNPKIQ